MQALLERKILYLYYSLCLFSLSDPLHPDSCGFEVCLHLVRGVPRSYIGCLVLLPHNDLGDVTDTVTEPIDSLAGSQVERLKCALLSLQHHRCRGQGRKQPLLSVSFLELGSLTTGPGLRPGAWPPKGYSYSCRWGR